MNKKQATQEKITKNSELASVLGSKIDSEMDDWDEVVGLGNLREELHIKGKDGKLTHPHFDTLKHFLELFEFMQPLLSTMDILHDNNKDVSGIRKVPRPDISFKNEIRTNQTNIMNKLDSFEEMQKQLKRIIESIMGHIKI